MSGNRVIDARELEGLEPYLVSSGVYEWKVNVKAGNFNDNYVKNHLNEVSSILSENEGFSIIIIEAKNAIFGLGMSKIFWS